MAHPIPRESHLPNPFPTDPGACLGRTCMKWSADGELTDLDVQLILQRLGSVDPALEDVLAQQAHGQSA